MKVLLASFMERNIPSIVHWSDPTPLRTVFKRCLYTNCWDGHYLPSADLSRPRTDLLSICMNGPRPRILHHIDFNRLVWAIAKFIAVVVLIGSMEAPSSVLSKLRMVLSKENNTVPQMSVGQQRKMCELASQKTRINREGQCKVWGDRVDLSDSPGPC